MLARMSASEIHEWELFDQLEPFGALVDELRIGHICATLANLQTPRHGRTWVPKDFLTTFEPAPVIQSSLSEEDSTELGNRILEMFRGIS